MRKLGVEEKIVKLVQGMFENVWSCVRVGEGLSEEFKVKIGPVHCSSSSYSGLCHLSFRLEYLGKICMQMTLSSLQTPWKNASEGC